MWSYWSGYITQGFLLQAHCSRTYYMPAGKHYGHQLSSEEIGEATRLDNKLATRGWYGLPSNFEVLTKIFYALSLYCQCESISALGMPFKPVHESQRWPHLSCSAYRACWLVSISSELQIHCRIDRSNSIVGAGRAGIYFFWSALALQVYKAGRAGACSGASTNWRWSRESFSGHNSWKVTAILRRCKGFPLYLLLPHIH